ncbi:hypothetical protein [endosymbiont GvMRE of Glomus versiforme]|uniref:hypothetical protein n=1 Tax=endosymbiont GvMRE of Glomus versiforme TaxID=2039283 RepID=UPI000EBE017D|nr:hypothetical protein [endosymbiont GvMRE of Glomus versiforme]RHZ36797.1 hypothetical protein GvMRE_I2g604 [endosymbiont GvMRE of Glomus versiforme]
MIDAQKWLNEKYPNRNEIKQIKLEEETLITGQLLIDDFPCLEKINVEGNWDNWGKLTGLVIKKCPKLKELNFSYNEIEEFAIANCPQLHNNFDYSFNKQLEELTKFDGSKLDYNVVSYIGSLDNDLYQQLKAGLPGTKHEDLQRLCLGCLTEGGHKNSTSYNYYAEIKLTKGGTVEYGVTATGNRRETFEVPEEGGLLIVNINAADGGTIKIKRNQIKNANKSSKESEEREKEKLVEMIQKLENKLKEVSDEQWKKQLEEGKKELEEKLIATQKKLEDSEEQKQKLQFEYDELKQGLEERKEQIEELKQVKIADQQNFKEQVEELEKQKQLTENETKILQKLKELFSIFNEQLDSKNVEKLEKLLKDYKEADFTNTPHLPDIFKLENEGISGYIGSSINHYYEWQEARKEVEKLRSNIKQEEGKNAEKIEKLKQKINDLSFRTQEQQIASLQEELKIAQDYAKELKNTLKSTVQTLEKETQTDLTSEDINQKDLQIEYHKQQLTKQKRLSIKIQPINPSLGDTSWTKLSTETGEKPLSPSQIRAREKQKKQQQEQSAQIQQVDYPPNPR